ncbi:lipocalin family protein, partial [uncultured Flavobacterium sp.]|uniref:lipocalin family protein n=1 Tax=uncultured Flavobacterium sp. TaxID=165435 RepID=UPI0030EEFA08
GCNKDYSEIIAGGTLKDVYYESNGAGGCDEFIDTLNWTRNGNTITVSESGFSTTGEIVELTNTTLKTKYTDPADDSVYITVFTRK